MDEEFSFDPFGVGPAAKLKKIVARHLITTRDWTSDPVLASEVVIDGYRGRVDLALFNGHMHAFEIKSDADRLERLPSQLYRMLNHFERVVVVCTERHRKRVEAIVEGSGRLRTGVWIIEESGRVDIVKRAKSSIVKDSAVLASFLLRSDIEGLLEQQRIPYERAEFAYNLREKIKVVNLALLRDAALTSFKNRFRERSLNLIARIQENQE